MTKTATRRVRREYGEGSVFFEENRSRWVGLLSQPKRDGKAQPRKKFTGKSRQEVLKKLREAKRDLDDGKRLGAARDTVGALLSDWQERGYPLTRAKSGNTLAGYAWAIEHLTDSESGIGSIRLQELTADEIEPFLDGKIHPTNGSRPLGHRSVLQIERVLRTALQWGKRNGRVRFNAADDVVTPDDGGCRPSRTFSTEEMTALLAVAEEADTTAMKHSGQGGQPSPLQAAWSVMAGLGLRPGECFALRWKDVDWDAKWTEGNGEGRLYVRGSLVRDQKSNLLYVGPLKTVKSQRNLDMAPQVLDALRAHQRWQREAKMRNRAEWDQESDLVFTNDSGGPLDPSAVRRRFKKLCAAAGLPEDRHPHELRHSCASYLSVVLGVPLERVADVLGHSGISTLLAVYRHVDVRSSVPHALGMAAVFPIRPAEGA